MPDVRERSILLVEDESDIAGLITLHLEGDGARVHRVADGVEGLSLAPGEPWDLVLPDISLPRCDGLAICEAVRRRRPTLPIVIVTARGAEEDRVRGLDLGADDYLAKPFGVAELVARVRAVLRRMDALAAAAPAQSSPAETVVASDVELRPVAREASMTDRPVALTPKEFDLLLTFCRAPERVFARAALLREVWGHAHEGYLHTVNTHINRLRAKTEPDPSAPRYVTTVWGVGYKLALP